MSRVYIIMFSAFLVTKVIFAVVSLLMGIKIRKTMAREAGSSLGLGIILLSIAFLFNALLDSRMINPVMVRSFNGSNAEAYATVILVMSYLRLVPRILNLAGWYFIADYCGRKYGSHIKIPVLVIPFLRDLIYHASVLIFKGESVLVKIPACTALLNITFAVAALSVFTVTFFRNREKEDTFRFLYVIFIVLIAGEIFANLLLLISAFCPEIVVYLADLATSAIPLVLPVYAFICAGNTKVKATE